jgi:exodeoxyribonuclease VII large subunit
MCVPDARQYVARLGRARGLLGRAMHVRLTKEGARLTQATSKLGDPRLAIARFQQRLDDPAMRLEALARSVVDGRRSAVERLQHRLAYRHPRATIDRARAQVVRSSERLASIVRRVVERRASTLAAARRASTR